MPFKFIIMTMIMVIFGLRGAGQEYPDDVFTQQRKDMVEQQIIRRGVASQLVLDAMLKVERHQFVPTKYQSEAYRDYPLPIGAGQTISQPYIVAFMTEALDLKATDKILEVGTGSGYQAAVLAEICDSVFSIEIIDMLAEQAGKALKKLNYHNVYLKHGDGYEGWPGHAPYDAIIVTCAPTHVPDPLKDQLAEGGKMIIPVGKSFTQELVLLEKKKGKLVRKQVLPVRFVPMLDPQGDKY